jgi:hypothetical protein
VSTGSPGFGSNQDLVASPDVLVAAPTDSFDFSFDFVTLPLLPGEYVSSIVATVVTLQGIAQAPGLITNVAVGPGSTPTAITARVNFPIDQCDYLVTVVVTTDFTGSSGASETRSAVFWVQGRAA